jgi:hypothetical protein
MSVDPPAPDAVQVQALPSHMVRVHLADGRVGMFDVGPLLKYPAYSALRNPGYFSRVRVEHGVVCWPDGEDLAPESVAARLKVEDEVDGPEAARRRDR